MAQYGFFFDQSRCYDCKNCVITCKDWNGLPPGPEKWLHKFSWEEGSYPQVRLKSIFAPCYHCENPACVAACPTGAMFKEDEYGAVLVDATLCTGCGDCLKACPYGAPTYHEEGEARRMAKCTMCIDRLKDGKQPICATACPMRALDFGPMEEMEAKYGSLKKLDSMPDPDATNPSIVFRPVPERKQLIPYDVDRARELLGQREGFAPLYESTEELTEVFDGLIGRDRLIMKPESVEQFMEVTRNDEG